MPTIETTTIALMLWAIFGYGIGSIPFGLVLARVMGLGNLREIGSGNIGATNVLRTGNKKAAALTLLLDAGKGAFVVLIAKLLANPDAVQLAALMAMIGHCYPVWLRFKGGKGVATFLGIMLALAWPAGIGCCIACRRRHIAHVVDGRIGSRIRVHVPAGFPWVRIHSAVGHCADNPCLLAPPREHPPRPCGK